MTTLVAKSQFDKQYVAFQGDYVPLVCIHPPVNSHRYGEATMKTYLVPSYSLLTITHGEALVGSFYKGWESQLRLWLPRTVVPG